MRLKFPARPMLGACVLATLLAGCSVKRYAVNRIGDALAEGGSVYETDDDIELVGEALPFSLKLLESLIAESPNHRGLLTAACRGFAIYAYVYVQQEAETVKDSDLDAYHHGLARARRLYLRALGYGLRGLEVSMPGVVEALSAAPGEALGRARRGDVPLLYWSAASLGLAISVAKDDAAMIARIPEVDAMINRALALDEAWDEGALHEFILVLSGARPFLPPDGLEVMRRAYERALALSGGRRASLFVAFAEAVSVKTQNAAEFKEQLGRALAIDPDEHEPLRLVNLVSQRKARRLLDHIEDYFLLPEDEE